VGRPTKYSSQRVDRICAALTAGNTRRAAAVYGGIGENTFGDWMRRFRDFRDAIEKAEAEAEVRAVAQIAQAAQSGTWTAAAWWLERRRPDDYGRRERLDVEHYVRTRARELGLDEDQAYEAVKPRLRLMTG
jgi:transposase